MRVLREIQGVPVPRSMYRLVTRLQQLLLERRRQITATVWPVFLLDEKFWSPNQISKYYMLLIIDGKKDEAKTFKIQLGTLNTNLADEAFVRSKKPLRKAS